MKTRTPFYSQVDRHGEATGVALLTHSFADFWPQIEDRFTRQVAKALYQDRTPDTLERLLEQARLGSDATSFAEWFVDYDAPSVELPSDSLDGLRELAALAEDLARDDGEWKNDARVLDQPAKQAVADLWDRLRDLKHQASQNHGAETSKAALEFVRRAVEQTAADTHQPERWTVERTAELEKVARELRALAHPHGPLKRAIIRIYPKLTLRLVLGDVERNLVKHQLLPIIQRATRYRFEHERTRRVESVREILLGRPGKAGLIDHVIDAVERDIQFFHQVAAMPTNGPVRSTRTALHEIRLFESLDEVIDPQKKGFTLAQLYGGALKRSGCRVRELADRIREEGLTIHGRHYDISDWPRHLKPADVRRAVQREVAGYLGSSRRDTPINIVEPRTAFEHAAAITPLHPALRSRLASLVPAWIRQSQPYADTELLVGAEPQVYRFLYCHPADRGAWEKLLCAKITPSNPMSATGVVDAFTTGHPYTAILVQHALALPLGVLRTLPSCTSQGNLLRRTDAHTAIFDRNSFSEVRLLPLRPSDYVDGETLFEAGRKAKIVLPVPQTAGPSRYTMTNITDTLQTVFRPDLFEPDLLTDELFHKMLRQRSFREFVVLTFPQAADFHQTADNLVREHDSTVVAQTLADFGILKAGAPGHYRLNVPAQPDQGIIPKAAFSRRPGPLVGLSQDEFVSQLHRNDLLYNAVFWRVVDATELAWLSLNDVPEFLRRFVRMES